MPQHTMSLITPYQIGRHSIAIVFLLSGILPLFNPTDSFALLKPFTDTPIWQNILFYSMVAMDIGLGLLACFYPNKRLWQAMFAIVLSYTVVCSIALPALWLEPLGSLLKNITILSWLWVLGFCPKTSSSSR